MVEFAILGPLEVLDQHRRIEVSSAKERLLLAMLVVHANEVVSTDRLIEVLWGGTTAGHRREHVANPRFPLAPGARTRSCAASP